MARPRAEDCLRLTVGDLRLGVARGAATTVLSDGVEIELAWRPTAGSFGGSGLAMVLVCPTCRRHCRTIHQPPGGAWSCWSCCPLSMPSHRRSGARAGRPKPSTWRTDQLRSEQRRALALLGLERLVDSPSRWSANGLVALSRKTRIHPRRRLALAERVVAAHALATIATLRSVAGALERMGGVAPSMPPTTSAVELIYREALQTTSWATRRPASDARTGRDRPRRRRLNRWRPAGMPRKPPPWLTC
jgi:hypothetical protein